MVHTPRHDTTVPYVPPPSTSVCPDTTDAMPCHATPSHATPCHVTPCHVTSSCLPLQPIDCWSTWPRRRHQVNVRTQLVRSTSLAYSLTISRTRHRCRRRSTGILTSPTIHHGRGLPSTHLAHHPLTLSLAVMYYVLRPRSHSMYTGHPRHRDPHSPRSLPIMQVAQNSALPLPMPFLVAAASHHHVAASGTTATTTTTATISTRHQLHQRHLRHLHHLRHHPRPAAAAAAIVHCHHHRQIKSTHMQHGSER